MRPCAHWQNPIAQCSQVCLMFFHRNNQNLTKRAGLTTGCNAKCYELWPVLCTIHKKWPRENVATFSAAFRDSDVKPLDVFLTCLRIVLRNPLLSSSPPWPLPPLFSSLPSTSSELLRADVYGPVFSFEMNYTLCKDENKCLKKVWNVWKSFKCDGCKDHFVLTYGYGWYLYFTGGDSYMYNGFRTFQPIEHCAQVSLPIMSL